MPTDQADIDATMAGIGSGSGSAPSVTPPLSPTPTSAPDYPTFDKVTSSAQFQALAPHDKRQLLGLWVQNSPQARLLDPQSQAHLVNMAQSQFPDLSSWTGPTGSLSGKVSTFGGDADKALWDKNIVINGVRQGDPGTTASGHSTLGNPNLLYAALPGYIRSQYGLKYGDPITVVHPNGKSVTVPLWDNGPGKSTSRLIDISPAAMMALGGNTDDTVTFHVPNRKGGGQVSVSAPTAQQQQSVQPSPQQQPNGAALGSALGQIAGPLAREVSDTAHAEEAQAKAQQAARDAAKAAVNFQAIHDYRQKFLQPGDKSDPAAIAEKLSLLPDNQRLNTPVQIPTRPTYTSVGTGGVAPVPQTRTVSLQDIKSDAAKQAILLRAHELDMERKGQPQMYGPLTNQPDQNAVLQVLDKAGAFVNAAAAPVKLGLYEAGKAVKAHLPGPSYQAPEDVAEQQRLNAMPIRQRMAALAQQPVMALGQPAYQRMLEQRAANEGPVSQGLLHIGEAGSEILANPVTYALGGAGALAQGAAARGLPLLANALRTGEIAANTGFTVQQLAHVVQSFPEAAKDPIGFLFDAGMATLGGMGLMHAIKNAISSGVPTTNGLPETTEYAGRTMTLQKDANGQPIFRDNKPLYRVSNPRLPEEVQGALQEQGAGAMGAHPIGQEGVGGGGRQGVGRGQQGTEVAGTGQAQPEAQKPPIIIASNLDRATDTAEAVAKKTGGSVQTTPALQPMHLGEAEGTMTSAKLAPIMEDYFRNRPNDPLPGTSKEGVPGESPNQYVGRSLPFLQQIMQRVGNGTVDIGRHGTTRLNNANANVEVTRGATNVPLDAQGVKDANRVADQMAKNPPDVYLSAHYRTGQLAQAAMDAGWVPVDPRNPVGSIDVGTFLSHNKTNEPGTVLRVHVQDGRPVRWERFGKDGEVVESGSVPPSQPPRPLAPKQVNDIAAVTAGGDIRNAADLSAALQEHFKYAKPVADATASIADAHANVWSRVTGRPVEEWYGRVGVRSGEGQPVNAPAGEPVQTKSGATDVVRPVEPQEASRPAFRNDYEVGQQVQWQDASGQVVKGQIETIERPRQPSVEEPEPDPTTYLHVLRLNENGEPITNDRARVAAWNVQPVTEASKKSGAIASAVPDQPSGPRPTVQPSTPPTTSFKRENAPQVAQTTRIKRVPFVDDRGKSHNAVEILIPGYEEYNLIATPPSGNKANGTKAPWTIWEANSKSILGYDRVVDANKSTLEGAAAWAKKGLDRIGKAKLDDGIRQRIASQSAQPVAATSPATPAPQETTSPSSPAASPRPKPAGIDDDVWKATEGTDHTTVTENGRTMRENRAENLMESRRLVAENNDRRAKLYDAVDKQSGPAMTDGDKLITPRGKYSIDPATGKLTKDHELSMGGFMRNVEQFDPQYGMKANAKAMELLEKSRAEKSAKAEQARAEDEAKAVEERKNAAARQSYYSNLDQRVSELKGKRGTFKVAANPNYPDAPTERTGTIYGDFAIHKTGEGKYAKYEVTHLKTGLRVGDSYDDLTTARRVIAAINHLDWDFTNTKDWKPEVRQEAAAAIKAIRKNTAPEGYTPPEPLFQRGEANPSDRVAPPHVQRWRILSPDRESEVTVTDSPEMVAAARAQGYHPVPIQEDFAASKASQPEGPGRLFQREENAPTFYSKAERVVTDKMANRMPADALRKMLLNNGVKPEEMKWSGLDSLLDQGGAVTKDEIRQHLAENNVRVQEVVKGQGREFTPEDAADTLRRGGGVVFVDSRGNQIPIHDSASVLNPASGYLADVRAGRGKFMEEGGATKYGNYQLPGGEPETYRELLLTLPVRDLKPEAAAKQFYETFQRKGGEPAWEELSPAAQQEVIRQVPSFAHADTDSMYRSSHWDEPNVLAHVRFNDRTGPNGEKILHVEEIQSDWHQAGRKKGYAAPESERLAAAKELRDANEYSSFLLNQTNRLLREKYGNSVGLDPTNPDFPELIRIAGNGEWDGLADELKTARERVTRAQDEVARTDVYGAVPNAPFSKTWHELAAKRVLRYAAENGYSKVSWTPGEDQAARYDLSKQVDAVRLTPDNRLQVVQKGTGNFQELDTPPITESNLADYIGKDAAEKLLAAPETHKGREISGVDLKVGGEGMKGFYDKILPDTFNKLGKPFGAKVGETRIPTGASADVLAKYADNEGFVKANSQSVPSIDITDSLRRAATSEGFPLFQHEGTPKASIEFPGDRKAVITALSNPDASTGLHEVSHIFRRDLEEMAPHNEQYAADYQTAMEWAGAKEGKWDTAAEEKWARGFEQYMREGKAPDGAPEGLARVFSLFRDWLMGIYQRIKGSAIDTGLSDEMRAVFDRQLRFEEPREAGKPTEAATAEPLPAREPGAEVAQTGVQARNAAPDVKAEEDVTGIGRAVRGEPATELPHDYEATSARKETMARDREQLDLPQLPDAERKSWQTSLDNAQKSGIPDRALAIANEVNQKPRSLNDEETAGMALRAQSIKNAVENITRRADATDDPTELASLRSQEQALQDEFDTLSTALKKSGTEKGRALASQKLTINRDMDLTSVRSRMRLADPDKPLTPMEDARVADLTKRLADAETKLTEHQERIKDLEAMKAARAAAVKEAAVQKGAQRRQTRQELRTEFGDLLDQFRKVGGSAESDTAKFSSGLTDEHVKLIAKMAVNLAKQGINEAGALVDTIHNAVSKVVPTVTKDDVRDAILSADPRVKAAKTRLTKQIGELTFKTAVGDTEKAGKRPAVELDAEGQALKAQRDRLQYQIEQMIAARQRPHWTDYLARWQRFGLLSGLPTLGKLTAAASGRIALSPIEDLIGGVVGKALPGIAKRAAREGAFSPAAEAKALTETFSRATLADMGAKLRTGAHALDVAANMRSNKLPEAYRPLMDFFGSLHGALKTPAQRNEYFRSFEKRAEFAARTGADLRDPTVQSEIAAQAYADSKRAILMNDNLAVALYRHGLQFLQRQGEGGKTAAGVAQLLTPIVKVPTNYAGEAANYIAGGPIGVAKLIMAKGAKNLSPEQADSVLRAFKKQGVGVGLMALGYMAAGNKGNSGFKATGYYVPGQKQPSTEHPTTMTLFGVEIPHYLLHTSALEAVHFGATLRRVMDQKMAKEGRAGAAVAGVHAGARGLAEQVPFVREMKDVSDSMQSAKSAATKTGDVARSIAEPQLLQWIAAATDKNPNGQIVKRSPRGFTDAMKMGVPGLREQVPAKQQRSSLRSSLRATLPKPSMPPLPR